MIAYDTPKPQETASGYGEALGTLPPDARMSVERAADVAVAAVSPNWANMTKEQQNAELDTIFGADTRDAAEAAGAGTQERGSAAQSTVQAAQAAAATEDNVRP